MNKGRRRVGKKKKRQDGGKQKELTVNHGDDDIGLVCVTSQKRVFCGVHQLCLRTDLGWGEERNLFVVMLLLLWGGVGREGRRRRRAKRLGG